METPETQGQPDEGGQDQQGGAPGQEQSEPERPAEAPAEEQPGGDGE